MASNSILLRLGNLLSIVLFTGRSRLPFLLMCCLLFSGCRHTVQEDIRPSVIPAPSYSVKSSEDGQKLTTLWWRVFDDELLNGYIQTALTDNFTLQEGYARLKQARISARQADSRLYPSLGGRLSGTSLRRGGEPDDTSTAEVELAWEIDLWGKLSSAARSASFEALASESELQGMALLLSAEAADTYFQLIEQTLYRDLLLKQITANETSLDLIKLRFANGAASLVDVYQQEDLVASVKAQLPLNEARTIVLRNRLHVLLGRSPTTGELPLGKALPRIPPLPQVGIPADLLLNRPDLRQLQQELVAADYRVAEAVADRLPTISVGSSAGFVNGDLIVSIFADALATIFDWGIKKSEVDKQQAFVEEQIARYSQRYLLAVEEVENALWQERQHVQLLAALERQLQTAQATLNETRNRYMQGITDYLPVLAALVSLQNLERTILERQMERLSYRLQLYRALGGNVLFAEYHPYGSEK